MLLLLNNTWQVRVPFSSFRPVKPDDPPLDPFLIHKLTIRFEPRRQVSPVTLVDYKYDLYYFSLRSPVAEFFEPI